MATLKTTLPRFAKRTAPARTLLVAAVLTALATACGDYTGGGSGASARSSASTPATGSGGSLPDAAQSIPAFEAFVWPLLQANCSSCHSGAGPGSPSIAHPDVSTAYFATVNNQKVNLGNPIDSRLVQRLAVDLHYCWGVCIDNAEEMRAAIASWAADVSLSGGSVDPGAIRSEPLALANGIEIDSNDERYSTNRIAYWEFKEGSGTSVADTSGVSPAMDLTLQGDDVTWLPSYGIDIFDGRAIAGSATSHKLYDQIAAPATGSQQYSVEAWIVPANIDQGDDTPRIISYSRGRNRRNFTLGQVFYQYSFRNRNVSGEISLNGTPTLLTYDMDRDAQATLQHVVITYDQNNGRRIYVDGQWTDDVDEQEVQALWNWDPEHAFVLGNETSNNRQWNGKIQLVAIYRQALTLEQISQNYRAGVGRKVVLRFDMSAWAGPGAYLEFLVSSLDSNSYLFCSPVFYAGDTDGIRISGIRILVNGTIPVNGQAFSNVDSSSFGAPVQVSRLCSIITQQKGPELDVFEVDIETVGDFQHEFVETVTPFPSDDSVNESVPVEGLRDFERLNASMAAITGVSPATPGVRQEFEALEQQLPAGIDIRTFVSSNQVAITKLALEYCDALVEDPVLRDDFFGPETPFPFGSDVATAFAGSNADRIVDPLVANAMGTGIPNQPDALAVGNELHGLITSLNATCTLCDAQRTRDTVKAACTAILASAVVALH